MAHRGADVPDMLLLLGQPGCVLCRVRDDAAGTWARWFRMENHHDPELLDRLERSVGFCPAHTRRLLAEAGARLLRQPLESAVRGACRRAEQIKVQPRPAWLRRRPAPAPCPLCRATRERERSAADDLAAALGHPLVAAAIRDRGGLCVRHLLDLLPRLSSRVQVGPAAAAAAARLCALVPGEAESRFMLAGRDPDAFARLPYLKAHVRQLDTQTDRSPMHPAERLIADLAGDSCPACRAVGRAQTRYLRWLDGAVPPRAAALCPRHLHDSQVTAGAGTRVVSACHAAARDQLTALAAGTSARPAGRPCGACQAGEDTERRQLSLLRACLPDAEVRRALDDAHGVCLRHAAAAAGAGRDAAPVVSRLVAQLRQAQRDLANPVARQARGGQHGAGDRGQDASRRIPALVDGEVYLGIQAWSSRSAT